MAFLTRRLGFYLVAAWAALTINFLIPHLMPGNPMQVILSHFQGKPSAAQVLNIEQTMGLQPGRSLLAQYVTYLGQLLHGDLGISITYFPASVRSVIDGGLPWTVCLVGGATVISFLAGTFAGLVAGWRRGNRLADAALPASTFLNSVPYFWIGLLALTVFAVDLGWFPLSGGAGYGQAPSFSASFIGAALDHAALPALTIVVSSFGGWLLTMRNMTVTTMSEDYITVARAKGLPESRIMLAYAARNALLPNLSAFALSLGFVVSGAIVTEIIFSYPGIGFVLFNAVANEDYPLMQGVFLVITVAVLVANLLADGLYVLLDPRIRQGAGR
jgi:peptide/nickel transport system permease protein